jgi:hypothetical protein
MLKDEMPPMVLCPKANFLEDGNKDNSADETPNHATLSIYSHQSTIGNHTKDFPISASLSSSWDTNILAMLIGLSIRRDLIDAVRESTDVLPKDRRVVVPILNPLENSVLVIVWEFFQYPSSQSILCPWTKLHSGSIGGVIRLLRSVAIYEAALDNKSAKVSAKHQLSDWFYS